MTNIDGCPGVFYSGPGAKRCITAAILPYLSLLGVITALVSSAAIFCDATALEVRGTMFTIVTAGFIGASVAYAEGATEFTSSATACGFIRPTQIIITAIFTQAPITLNDCAGAFRGSARAILGYGSFFKIVTAADISAPVFNNSATSKVGISK